MPILMIKDAVECLIDNKNFSIEVFPSKDDHFYITSSNDSLLIGFALKQQRTSKKLTVRDIAKRLGSNSPTAYSRYESGRVKPSLDKLSQLLKAIDPNLEPVLSI